MTAPIAFVDTETTGLTLDDEVWEFAYLRHDEEGWRSAVMHIDHNFDRVQNLPEKFRADHDQRWGKFPIYSRVAAREIIHSVLDGVHIVGANPAFDAGMLERLLADSDLRPSWHYHLIDLEAMTLGYLAAKGETVPVPWRSDDLSARVGVPTKDENGDPLYDRHTALGDITWCRDWWNALTGGHA